MDVMEFRDYCLSLPFTDESTPFDQTTLVYKVGGRMFAYAGMDDFRRICVKCDPEEAEQLRETYPEITPAHHSSKRHWNDIAVAGDLPDALIREQIRNSYIAVLCSNVTPRQLRDKIIAAARSAGIIV